MIHIAGGSYIERCSDPYYHEFYGSGLRAAVALSRLASRVHLATYVSAQQLTNLEVSTESFGISCKHFPCPETIKFDYLHPMGIPRISPHPAAVSQAPPFRIDAERVLRFGFIEGDSVVNGDWVVYDPQSPRNPRPFSENTSKAKHLALVANLNEARLLSGKSDLDGMGNELLKSQQIEVVVIKQGPLGCTVFCQTEQRKIPVFATKSVWPIGSGDVFSASFAHYWAELGLDPFIAAEKSSLATAFYCSMRTLPLPTNIEEFAGFERERLLVDDKRLTPATVYLAGPFFTMAERYIIGEAKYALEAQGLDVFSPYHEVGLGPSEHVVPADIDGIEKSQLVFAILDGLDPGTIFEIGYARKANLPVVIFVQHVSAEDMKMFEGTDCQIVDDFSSAIYRTVWTARHR
ncbi:MAG: PfkB family carbohydrate kinase [Candidatus Acidiferrales bacterium]